MPPPLIELVRVRREYPSGDGIYTALQDIDLTINSGEMVAIVGASGSGKSTLMNILGGLDKPSIGRYFLAGQDIGNMDADALAALRRERVGFIFQRYNLLPDLTALENVEVPAIYAGRARNVRHDRAQRLLKRLKLANRLNHRPSQLSGGQQQRVSIARALMNGGEIILADEPTGALDSEVGEEVLAILKELNAEGHTVIIVTHDEKVARHAERILELSDGRIVSDRRKLPALQPRTTCARAVPEARESTTSNTLGIFLDALRMALRAMVSRRLRTFLTMLGIIIGVASVASVVALGKGGQQKIIESIRILGTNTIEVFPGKDEGDQNAKNIHTLVPADVDAIAAQGHVDSVTPMVSKSASARFGSESVMVNINGVGENYFRVHDVDFSIGRGFSATDRLHMIQVAVIDDKLRKALFAAGQDPLGQVIILDGVPFQVIGATKSKEYMDYLGAGFNTWAPYTSVMGRVLGHQYLKTISVRVNDESPIDLVGDVITRLLVQRHGRQDFFLYNTDAIRHSVERSTATMTFLVASIAVISLIVGGIGVMNITLVSVTERTREIGVRTAVGARRRDILQQFLIEAVIVCLIGGMLGVALAFAVGVVFSRFFADFPMIFSGASIAVALVVSGVIGIVFGFIPARNAARLDPVEALVRE